MANTIVRYTIGSAIYSMTYDHTDNSLWLIAQDNGRKIIKFSTSTGGVVGSYDGVYNALHAITYDATNDVVWVDNATTVVKLRTY